MKYGITGTRVGMTEQQKKTFLRVILSADITEFHHGDCVGVDVETAALVKQHFPACKIICHPPVDGYLRGYFSSHEYRPEKDYKTRNQAIVDEIDFLIAIPKETEVQKFGGTWDTYKRGNKKAIPVLLIRPNGRFFLTKNVITSTNNEHNDYKYYIQKIDDLISSCDWAYDTLSGIKDWVVVNEAITEKQINAIENIEAAHERNRGY